MKKEELILLGGGGHCKACIDVIEREGKFQIVGIIDRKENIGQKVSGYPIIGSDNDLKDLTQQYKNFLVTIGQLKSAAVRQRLFKELENYKVTCPVVISSLAYVSPQSKVKKGSIIMHGAIINAGATIGKNCIVNTRALVEHDCEVGDHVHLSTNSVINGQVKVGDGCFVGSSSVVLNNRVITSDVVIGAGSTVIKDITTSGIYVGSPAKRTSDE